MTIRVKLALWYSGLITLIIVILCLTVISVTRWSILNSTDQVLIQTANTLIESIRFVPAIEAGSPIEQIVFGYDELFSVPNISIQVWQTTRNGQAIEPRLIRASASLADYDGPLDTQALQMPTHHLSSRSIQNTSSRVVSMPFHGPSSQAQLGVVQVVTTLDAIYRANEVLVVITLIAATISIVVSVSLSLWLSGRVLKPIGKITQAANSIARAEDLSTRLEWTGPMDEVGQLADVFNHMMERLETLFSVQQRFVGDVSHELRTPLTSILGNLEIMQRYGVDKDSLEAVYREAARMSRMVNDLLLLHRAEFGELEVILSPLDLDMVLLEIYEQAPTLAKNRDLKFVLGQCEPTPIQGNTDRLKQLILNLLNNAIKFTPDGGTITLSAYIEKQQAVLEVRDTGIGIAEKDLNRIFDRFFQSDNSRVHRNEADGAGLGLSIVRWIVKVHQGQVTVASEIGKGTQFRVLFPLSKASQTATNLKPANTSMLTR